MKLPKIDVKELTRRTTEGETMTQIAKAVGVTTRYLRLLKEEEQLQKDIVALLQLLYRHPELAMAFTKEEEAAFNRLFTRFPFEPEVVL